jgi:plastocyanin
MVVLIAVPALLLSRHAGADSAGHHRITVTLGDYRFSPANIELHAGVPVILELVNTDKLTPHNFTLRDAAANLNIDVDVGGGETRQVTIEPAMPGAYTFYCNKKLPFVKSHRERGMEGVVTIVSD